MSNRFHVGTRKGLFTFERNGEQWAIADELRFPGVPVTMMFEDPRDGTLFAALNHEHFGPKLHRKSAHGEWTEVGTPAFPAVDSAGSAESSDSNSDEASSPPSDAPSVKGIWSLESAGESHPGWLWAGTISGGLFLSKDQGDSWELNRPLWDVPERANWFGGGTDFPVIHSICVDPRNDDRVLLGVSCGGVWVTEDGGQTWACRADGMRADYMPPEQAGEPSVQDAHCLVQSKSEPSTLWVQHHNGIFLSTDDAASWSEVKDVDPSTFGFAAAVNPLDHQQAWFVPAIKDELRLPVDGKLVVTRTSDGGRTFEKLTNGLPQEHCYDIVFRHALDVDETGKVLVMGSSTGGLWLSEDSGESWKTLSTHLPQIYCVRFAN